MLTGNLVRFRIDGSRIRPRYILRKQAPKYLTASRDLIQLVRDHTGRPQRELVEALIDYEGRRTDYNILRGLAKLLLEKAEFRFEKEMDYAHFRHQVFSMVQDHYPVVTKRDLLHEKIREQVIQELSDRLGISMDEFECDLYGDLSENQVLSQFNPGFSPEALLKKYNLALAQGLLYRAARMNVTLFSDYRVVFQYLKLSGLMHRIRRLPNQGFEIQINGPASLFSNTRRYGVRMARFLPGLILAASWKMRADIHTDSGDKQFYLDQSSGLSSHYKDVSPFDSQIESAFYDKFSRKDRTWQIQREGDILECDGSIFIPDFTFHHPDGRIAHLEIIGYWTPEYLENKLRKLRKINASNIILAVNNQLNCSRDDFEGDVIFFRTGLRLGQVLEKIEVCAVKEDTATAP